jgi:hypothetical protein
MCRLQQQKCFACGWVGGWVWVQMGHSGMYFNPFMTVESGPRRDPSRVFSPKTCVGTLCTSSDGRGSGNGGFTHFELQALELKRVLGEATAHGEPFYLSYRTSPDARVQGDSDGNQVSPLATAVWGGSPSSPLRCVRHDADTPYSSGATSSECTPHEAAVVASLDWKEKLALRWLVSNPYPVNPPGDTSKEISCFGP